MPPVLCARGGGWGSFVLEEEDGCAQTLGGSSLGRLCIEESLMLSPCFGERDLRLALHHAPLSTARQAQGSPWETGVCAHQRLWRIERKTVWTRVDHKRLTSTCIRFCLALPPPGSPGDHRVRHTPEIPPVCHGPQRFQNPADYSGL